MNQPLAIHFSYLDTEHARAKEIHFFFGARIKKCPNLSSRAATTFTWQWNVFPKPLHLSEWRLAAVADILSRTDRDRMGLKARKSPSECAYVNMSQGCQKWHCSFCLFRANSTSTPATFCAQRQSRMKSRTSFAKMSFLHLRTLSRCICSSCFAHKGSLTRVFIHAREKKTKLEKSFSLSLFWDRTDSKLTMDSRIHSSQSSFHFLLLSLSSFCRSFVPFHICLWRLPDKKMPSLISGRNGSRNAFSGASIERALWSKEEAAANWCDRWWKFTTCSHFVLF